MSEQAPRLDSQGRSERPAGGIRPWHYWLGLIVQPVLFLFGLAGVLFLIGLAQRWGWLPGGAEDASESQLQPGGEGLQYICPMMCTPPTSAPGRCPVCSMELVAAAADVGGDRSAVAIDPATRRLLGIQTAEVQRRPASQHLRSVGELGYDESSMKTLAAYVDGRVERLLANYTGVVVAKDDRLAWIYSPRLYAGQIELLLARRRQPETAVSVAAVPAGSLYANARRRLTEMGMTDSQIDAMEQSGEADSRLYLLAPIAGTVIEKLAAEGDYVREGDPIYRLADLSRLWLQLRLFPEDAAQVRVGQTVAAEVQSYPGRVFPGTVDFISPTVDTVSRTVAIRVELANPEGLLRVGDLAWANLELPWTGRSGEVFDPMLDDGTLSNPLVVPRDAVLMAGRHSVAYVETEAGRFELRAVRLGAILGDEVVILDGLEEGERVATRGNFLIDSQMQLSGKPSLIDPQRAAPLAPEPLSDDPPDGPPITPELPPIGSMELIP
jgi:membrane fusion protein, copper/silver efflux system